LGYVPQEPGLFGGTIFENVVLGDPAFSKDDVRRALVDAGAWEFVQELPLGMDAELGDRGSRLSGGQKQRIAIARALVRSPRLLVLDEVTSSLDPATEAGIIETLRGLRGRVTILAISHQRSVAEAADRELVMANGRLSQVRPALLRAAHA
jgi:ATP-binding cassette subfamily C protein